jgi:hypothetical protein
MLYIPSTDIHRHNRIEDKKQKDQKVQRQDVIDLVNIMNSVIFPTCGELATKFCLSNKIKWKYHRSGQIAPFRERPTKRRTMVVVVVT